MLHGDGPRIVPQRDLYLQAVERRRRRLEHEKRESTHVMRGIAIACFFGLLAYGLLLAI